MPTPISDVRFTPKAAAAIGGRRVRFGPLADVAAPLPDGSTPAQKAATANSTDRALDVVDGKQLSAGQTALTIE
jgi:hypothetical protein